MPSLRKRVSTYLRQLSFHNEPRDKRNNVNENAFVTKYLQGHITLRDGPPIIYGKNPTDLPSYDLGKYECGSDSIIGCYSGPNGGLTTVKRTEKHLSVHDDDIDFIDNPDDEEEPIPQPMPKKSPKRASGQPIDNTTMVIKVAGHEYCVTNKPKRHSKSFSLGSISDFNVEVEKTKINRDFYSCDSKQDDNEHTKKCQENQNICDNNGDDSNENVNFILPVDDTALPDEWNRKSDHYYGVSDSLYDRNQVTKLKNGDPIADCFGVIARNDSAILAVADGVNWGEKASIAAKSAVHASMHYLNKTIFNDTKPFENLTNKTDDESPPSDAVNPNEATNLVTNTKEVFVCLLRAFNCAHDLILENKGMLTTLTVAVILPLKQRIPQRTENGMRPSAQEPHYVCCVCNVGDTLAYVYSQRTGIRELTKGSHDVNSNRDMRDALGALGPVDGINPELSNLTLSITTLSRGDIVMVASDGLTDNFDPNVCKFTVNSTVDPVKNRIRKTSSGVVASYLASSQPQNEPEQKVHMPASSRNHRPGESTAQKPPIKPPRRSKNRSSSHSERSSSSVEKDAKATDEKNCVSAEPDPTFLNPVAEEAKATKSDIKKPPPVIENKASSLRRQSSSQNRQSSPPNKANPKTLAATSTKQNTVGYKFLKSKTSLDLRSSHQNKLHILRNDDGIPYVTPIQRYELQLLLMEDILKNGISGRDSPITTAKKLCESLVSFTMSITSAKRRTLEDQDMYFDNRNGVLVEVSNQEKKLRRKRGLEKVQSLPGKLDHVTVVAYNVGNVGF